MHGPNDSIPKSTPRSKNNSSTSSHPGKTITSAASHTMLAHFYTQKDIPLQTHIEHPSALLQLRLVHIDFHEIRPLPHSLQEGQEIQPKLELNLKHTEVQGDRTLWGEVHTPFGDARIVRLGDTIDIQP